MLGCILLLLGGCEPSSPESELEDTGKLLETDHEPKEFEYQCNDSERIQVRYEPRTDEMVLFLTDRAVRLRHVASASGAKYSAAGIIFWNKGNSALLQRAGRPDSECRQTG